MSDESPDREAPPRLDDPVLAEMIRRIPGPTSGTKSGGPKAGPSQRCVPWRLRAWEERALAHPSADETERALAAALAVAASISEARRDPASPMAELARSADPAGRWPEEISARLGRLSRECVGAGEFARATELASTRTSLERLLGGAPGELPPCPIASPPVPSGLQPGRPQSNPGHRRSRRVVGPAWRAFGFVVGVVGLVAGLAFLQPAPSDIRELGPVELRALSPQLAAAYVGQEGEMFFGTLAPSWSDLDADRRRNAARSLADSLARAGHRSSLVFDSRGRLVLSYRGGRLWIDPASRVGPSGTGS
ncbi:MAG: hypothetical protein ACE5IL_01275 [Myxococcota bacterium]